MSTIPVDVVAAMLADAQAKRDELQGRINQLDQARQTYVKQIQAIDNDAAVLIKAHVQAEAQVDTLQKLLSK